MIPTYQDLMLPMLRLLGDGREREINELADRLADEFALTNEERNLLLPSGGVARFRNRVGWAKTYMKSAGLVASPRRAVVLITERGRELLASGPARLDNDALEQFAEFRDFRARSRKSVGAPQDPAGAPPDQSAEGTSQATPLEMLETAHQRAEAALVDELLEQVGKASPQFFERLVVELLVKMGYGGSLTDAGRAVGGSGDGGIDGIIKEDKLGLDQIYIQAKRWQAPVGRPEIQKFAGALQGHRARKGVFMTTSEFTSDAIQFVDRIESKIVLVDGALLARMMIDNNVGVTPVRTFELKRVDGDFFVED